MPTIPRIDDVNELTEQRKSTHGPWALQADTAQRLKFSIKAGLVGGRPKLSASQAEAVDMILVKISRIVSGDPNEADHWDDIMGYAKLGRDGGHS